MSKSSYRFAEREGHAPDAPLFFAFHGTGGDEQQLFEVAGRLLPAAHLVSPRGDVSEGGALRFFKRVAQGQYDMGDLAQRTATMANFIESFETGGKRIGLGYSNGANILASVMFAQPQLFDAAVLMHPLIPFDPREGLVFGGRKILITAGRKDPICPAPLTEKLIAYFESQGADVTAFWHEGGHEVRDAEFEAVETFLAPYRN